MRIPARGRTAATLSALLLCLTVSAGLTSAAHADAAADARLRQRIESRLTGQISISLQEFTLEVRDGAVALSGTVGSVGEIEKVERLVAGIVGVRSIDNRLTVRESHRSEISIAQEVRRVLERQPRFRKAGLSVDVAKTRVTLGGQVERALDRREAGDIAASVMGVTEVDNRLTIASVGRLTAEEIGDRVRAALSNPLTFGVIRDLQVAVSDGVVTLEGFARSRADLMEAERLALAVPGVTDVANAIRVQNP